MRPVKIRIVLAAGALMALSVPLRADPMGTLVDFETNGGSIKVDLFDELTPLSVANFLNYLSSNRYNDTIIHQIGKAGTTPATLLGGRFQTSFDLIPQFPFVQNEFHHSNTRGTLAATKASGAPDPVNSTNSQWFFNVTDNTSFDSINGGYTVFGQVMGGSLSVIDAIAALKTFPVVSQNGQLEDVPHFGTSTLVKVQTLSVVKTHPAYQNPVQNADVNNDGSVFVLDLLTVINDLNDHHVHSVSGPFAGSNYLDVSGNGTVEPLDVLQVINVIQSQSSASSAAQPLLALNFATAVPEPATWTLASLGLSVLAGLAARRHLRTRRVK